MAINPQSLVPFITPYSSPVEGVRSQQHEYNTLVSQDEAKRSNLAQEAEAKRTGDRGDRYAAMQGEQYAYNRATDQRDFDAKQAGAAAEGARQKQEEESKLLAAWLKAKQDGDLTSMQAIASLMKERAGYSMELGAEGEPGAGAGPMGEEGTQTDAGGVNVAPLGAGQLGMGAAGAPEPPAVYKGRPGTKVADELMTAADARDAQKAADEPPAPEPGTGVADELMAAADARDATAEENGERVVQRPLNMGRSWLAPGNSPDPSSATAALEASPGRRPDPAPEAAPPTSLEAPTPTPQEGNVRVAPLTLGPGQFRLKKGEDVVTEGSVGGNSDMFDQQLQLARAAGDRYGAQAARRAQQFMEDRIAAGVPVKEAQKEALAFLEKEEGREKGVGRYAGFLGKGGAGSGPGGITPPGALAGTVGPGKPAPTSQEQTDDMALFGAVWRDGKTYDSKTGRELSAKEYEGRISNAESFRKDSETNFFRYAKLYGTDKLIAEEIALKKVNDIAEKARRDPKKYGGKLLADAISGAIRGVASEGDVKRFQNADIWAQLDNMVASMTGKGMYSEKAINDVLDQAMAAYKSAQVAHKKAANQVAYAMRQSPSTQQAPEYIDRNAVANSAYYRAMGERDAHSSYRSPGDQEDAAPPAAPGTTEPSRQSPEDEPAAFPGGAKPEKKGMSKEAQELSDLVGDI